MSNDPKNSSHLSPSQQIAQLMQKGIHADHDKEVKALFVESLKFLSVQMEIKGIGELADHLFNKFALNANPYGSRKVLMGMIADLLNNRPSIKIMEDYDRDRKGRDGSSIPPVLPMIYSLFSVDSASALIAKAEHERAKVPEAFSNVPRTNDHGYRTGGVRASSAASGDSVKLVNWDVLKTLVAKEGKFSDVEAFLTHLTKNRSPHVATIRTARKSGIMSKIVAYFGVSNEEKLIQEAKQILSVMPTTTPGAPATHPSR